MDELLRRLVEADALGLSLCGDAAKVIVAMQERHDADAARHSESRADAMALAYARLFRLVEPLLRDIRAAMSEDGVPEDLRDAERAATDILESAPPERLGAGLLAEALAAPGLRDELASRHLAAIEKAGLDSAGLATLGIASEIDGMTHYSGFAEGPDGTRPLPFQQDVKLTLYGRGQGGVALQAFHEKIGAAQRAAA